MKSKLAKSIAAVLALASAGAANAAIDSPQFGGDGELFLTIWDPTVGNEASFNIGLNINLSTFDSTGSYTFNNIFSDPTFLQYFGAGSAGGSNLGNTSAWQWNVVAASNLADQSKVLYTQEGVANSIPNAAVDNAATKTQTYQSDLGSCDSCGTDLSASPKYAGANWGSDFAGGVQLIDNAAGIGTALNFYLATNTTDFDTIDASSPASVVQQAYTWLLSNDGTLTYGPSGAPVPVPAAIWLLGSGLLGLAGIGRRRAAVQPA